MKLVKLVEVNSVHKANLLKSLLKSNGIKSELKDENSLSLQPDIAFGIQGVEIFVDENELKKAKEIIIQIMK